MNQKLNKEKEERKATQPQLLLGAVRCRRLSVQIPSDEGL